MKLGFIGQTGAGKSTIFEALTGCAFENGRNGQARIGTVPVPDERVDSLSRLYQPKKTTYAKVEYLLPAPAEPSAKSKDPQIWNRVRDCDALIHVVRNHNGLGFEAPRAWDDLRELDEELTFADLVSVEKRLERLAADRKRGKPEQAEEAALLTECQGHLETDQPLRRRPDLAGAPLLRSFAFVSAKPTLVLFNNADEDEEPPRNLKSDVLEESLVIRGKLERELAEMPEDEAAEFLEQFNIAASARDRVIERSYRLLGLISFFTVGDDEVRAWTIRRGTPAADAAEVIHSDIKKGFIRAEVVAYDDLMAAGSIAEARKRGAVRLEGKTYEVQDGDVIEFRFNV
ncbi:MAG: YchF family ATPase [Proteobacteria bacterium]|nr:YchF family ATPase [Pseudomonadota bacterium]